ncbi:hypothetical protein [Lelliottia wanjuensis]|uniref:hypothetical protein n=1 Tax=Lelliottia wanjuensis TaxID=3050585 RepID=UPI00254CDB7A|nr:hypothetical protein [Lelliottia sp. V86_10]MDK9585745.1 hypothetical protein [Lelliottia sp. V86_10]
MMGQFVVDVLMQCLSRDVNVIRSKIHEMENECLTSIIPESHFFWLKDAPRATYWLWWQIAHSCYGDNFPESVHLTYSALANRYKYISDSHLPKNHQERYDLLIRSFDDACFNADNTIQYLTFLNVVQNLWRKNRNERLNAKWLKPDDTEVCWWAYDNLIIKIKSKCRSEVLEIPKPLTSEEAYNSFYVTLDLCELNKIDIKNILDSVSKTWGQKKYRKSISQKRLAQKLDDEHMKMLEYLARYYQLDNIGVIKILISDRMKGITTAERNR